MSTTEKAAVTSGLGCAFLFYALFNDNAVWPGRIGTALVLLAFALLVKFLVLHALGWFAPEEDEKMDQQFLDSLDRHARHTNYHPPERLFTCWRVWGYAAITVFFASVCYTGGNLSGKYFPPILLARAFVLVAIGLALWGLDIWLRGDGSNDNDELLDEVHHSGPPRGN